jgi:hypothetical protein
LSVEDAVFEEAIELAELRGISLHAVTSFPNFSGVSTSASRRPVIKRTRFR